MYVSDHISNLLPEIGRQIAARIRRSLLDILDRFEALSSARKGSTSWCGRRVGLYKTWRTWNMPQRHELVEQIKFKLTQGRRNSIPKIIFSLMEDFI